jgi:hypothetical protein
MMGMPMKWRLKCLAFYFMNHALHTAAQRYLTRRYFEQITPDLLSVYGFHVENFRRLPAGSTALEIGAGRNLLCSLLLSHAGAARVYAFDLHRLATVEQVNAVIEQLRGLLPGEWPLLSRMDDLDAYRIDYRAPGDARRTGLGHVDFICSTSTLEHIPRDDLRAIHAECARLSPSLASHIVDYHDHYASFDRQIGRTNFYRYSERAWRKWNPDKHYQNRLRHGDQMALLAEAGFKVVSERRVVEDMRHPPLAETFRRYSAEDLATMNAFITLSL